MYIEAIGSPLLRRDTDGSGWPCEPGHALRHLMYMSGGVVKGEAMQFELLYIDGCPSWHQAVENLRQALRSEGPDMEISLIRVEGAGNAHELQFQGSPTIRLSGKDLFPDQPGHSSLTR